MLSIKEFKAKLSDILDSIFAVDNDFLEVFEFVEKDKTVEDKFKNFIFIKINIDGDKDLQVICGLIMKKENVFNFTIELILWD